MTAFQATYSDWKLIRTRRVVQIVLEVPIEQADQAYKVLGGMPLSGEETWVGVARLNPGAGAKQTLEPSPPETNAPLGGGSSAEQSVRFRRPGPTIAPEKRMTQRAGILCTDRLFQTWLRETNSAWTIMNLGTAEEKARQLVHVYCGVKSRKDIVPGSQAARLWDEMLGKYEAWQACLEEVS